jgi:type IX secretion system PorP/SprF family membrane protein
MGKSFLLKLLYKFLTTIVILILNNQFGSAQTVYRGNLYPYYKYTLNSAYAGADNYKSLFLDYRNASNSIPGSPTQLMFAFSMPVLDKMGLGLRLENHTEGLFNFITGFIDYSYLVKLNGKQNIRFGISGGISNSSLDNSKVIATDPSAINEIVSKYFIGTTFESAAGIVYQWQNLSVELSAPRLFGTIKGFKPIFSSLLAYKLKVLNNQLALRPSVLFMYQTSTPLSYDINLNAEIKENFMIGIGYRNRPGIVLSTGLLFNEIKLLYAAELGIGNYSNIFNTVHEISIGYTFKKVNKHPIDSTYNPPLDLIVKADSLPPDSTQISDIAQNDSLLFIQDIDTNKVTDKNSTKELEAEPELIEIADGIYALRQQNNDSTLTESKLDSILFRFHFKIRKRTKKKQEHETIIAKDTNNIRVTEISEGIYSVNIEDITDKNTGKLSDEVIDNAIEQMLIKDTIDQKNTNVNEQANYIHETFYTLLLDINKNSSLLNSTTQTSDNIRVERSKSGKIKYYYGKFSKKSSAQNAAIQIRRYGYTVIKIIKISAYL